MIFPIVSSHSTSNLHLAVVCKLMLITLLVAGCSNENPSPLIPTSVFFMNPDDANYTISPDGQHLAFLRQWGYRLNIHVQRVGTNEISRITSSTQRDITRFAWVDNDELILLQDLAGDGNDHLYIVGLDGSEPVDLTPFPGAKVVIVSLVPLDPEHIVIAMNQRDPRLLDCYRLKIPTGELELVAENPGDVAGWQADHQGRVRAAISFVEGASRVLYRETEADVWREVARSDLLDLFHVRGFTFDGELMYVVSFQGRDTEALYTFDPRRGEFVEMLFAHPEVDVYFLFFSYKKKLLRGVAFLNEHLDYHFFDEEGLGIHQDIESRLPGYLPWVTSLSDDESRMVVRTFTDRSLGSYYLLDRPSGELNRLADISPWIDETHMCPMEPVRFLARDGRLIWAYLIQPNGVKPKELPLVVIPCPTPWQQFSWGYHASAQFLANRGYAVLMVNPRGSLGLGKDYMTAGFGEWGGGVLDDLEDGANWLIDQDIVDPARVGIFGHSVGGYYALAAAMKKPGTFCCAISYSGPVNLETLVASPPSYWYASRDILFAMIGDPKSEADLARMIAASPLGQEEQFTVPLVVAQGANDPITTVAATDSFVARLEALGKDVRYVRFDDEGHLFTRTESRNELYGAVEVFLAKHLGGRVGRQVSVSP